jgi:hypothetical protein
MDECVGCTTCSFSSALVSGHAPFVQQLTQIYTVTNCTPPSCNH